MKRRCSVTLLERVNIGNYQHVEYVKQIEEAKSTIIAEYKYLTRIVFILSVEHVAKTVNTPHGM